MGTQFYLVRPDKLGLEILSPFHGLKFVHVSKHGGFGICDLSSLNSDVILKFAWDSYSSLSQWEVYLESMYPILSNRKLGYRKSSIWPSFWSIASSFKQNCHWLIGPERQIREFMERLMASISYLSGFGYFRLITLQQSSYGRFYHPPFMATSSFFCNNFLALARQI